MRVGLQDSAQLGRQLNDAIQGLGRLRRTALLRLCGCHRFGQLMFQLGDALGGSRLHQGILPRQWRQSGDVGNRRGDVCGRVGDRDFPRLAGEPVAQLHHAVGPATTDHHDPRHTEQLGVLELDTG